MSNQQIKTAHPIITYNKDNQLVADSTNIAEVFGKSHDKVVRDIENLIKTEQIDVSNFGVIFYTDSMNREQKKYELQELACYVLTLGFTGTKALKFKVDFASAFIDMKLRLEVDHLRQINMMHESIKVYQDSHLQALRETVDTYKKLSIKGTPITEAEKVEIRRLFAEELCKAEIARITGRSRDTVRRVLRSDVPHVH